jgi:hypothetical protein
LHVTPAKQPGDNAIPRFQHRADGWNLRGFIGDEMNEHLKANRKTPKSRLINSQQTNGSRYVSFPKWMLTGYQWPLAKARPADFCIAAERDLGWHQESLRGEGQGSAKAADRLLLDRRFHEPHRIGAELAHDLVVIGVLHAHRLQAVFR